MFGFKFSARYSGEAKFIVHIRFGNNRRAVSNTFNKRKVDFIIEDFIFKNIGRRNKTFYVDLGIGIFKNFYISGEKREPIVRVAPTKTFPYLSILLSSVSTSSKSAEICAA